VLFPCSETWTLLTVYTRALEAYHEMSTADPRCPVVWLHQQRWDRSTHRSPHHHGPHS